MIPTPKAFKIPNKKEANVYSGEMLGVIFMKITYSKDMPTQCGHHKVIIACEHAQDWKSSPTADPHNYKRSGSQQGRTLINPLNSFNEICGLSYSLALARLCSTQSGAWNSTTRNTSMKPSVPASFSGLTSVHVFGPPKQKSLMAVYFGACKNPCLCYLCYRASERVITRNFLSKSRDSA